MVDISEDVVVDDSVNRGAAPRGHQENSNGHENGAGHDHESTGYENGVGHQMFHGDEDVVKPGAPADREPNENAGRNEDREPNENAGRDEDREPNENAGRNEDREPNENAGRDEDRDVDPVGHQDGSNGHENGAGHDHESTGYENGVGHQMFHGEDTGGKDDDTVADDDTSDRGPEGRGPADREPNENAGRNEDRDVDPVGHQDGSNGHENGAGHDHESTGYENGVGHQMFHEEHDPASIMDALCTLPPLCDDDFVQEDEDDCQEDVDFLA